jgi:hypothetical protein
VPERIQRSRAAGWRLPPNAVVVSRPTRWGNPYRVGYLCPVFWVWNGATWRSPDPGVDCRVTDHDMAVALFARIAQQPDYAALVRAELAGKDLACWCPPTKACHADVLLEMANA